MHWGLAIAALVAAALVYACRAHVRDRRRLTALFASLAARHGGEVRPGTWLVLPQLRFERDGRHYLVAAMPNSGAHEGASGPFTFVDVELPADIAPRIPLREELSGSRLTQLEARVEGRKVSVHMYGIATSSDQLEELIEIAARLARG